MPTFRSEHDCCLTLLKRFCETIPSDDDDWRHADACLHILPKILFPPESTTVGATPLRREPLKESPDGCADLQGTGFPGS